MANSSPAKGALVIININYNRFLMNLKRHRVMFDISL
jgi:hypothetical protein